MTDINFGLADGEYWSDPQRTLMPVAQQLWAKGADTTAVGTPGRVVLEQRSTAPAVIYRGGSYRELWALSFLERAVVTAIEVERNQLYVGRLSHEEVEPQALDPEKAPAGSTTDSAVIDLREQLRLPWEPGRYLVTVLLREHHSNRSSTELAHVAGAFQDPEAARFEAEARAQLHPSEIAPLPGRPFPSYDRLDRSPPVPASPGIALSIERVVRRQDGARNILYGAFRLPVGAEEIVREPERVAGAVAADPPSAVVRIHLVSTHSGGPRVGVVTLDVPTWDAAAGPGAMVTGHFAVDAFELGLASPTELQTTFFYAFARAVMAGPVPSALVADVQR